MTPSRSMMALRWLVFALAAFLMNFPVISTLITSLKSETQMRSLVSMFWPDPVVFDNYRYLLSQTDFVVPPTEGVDVIA